MNTLGTKALCVLMQVQKRGGCLSRLGDIGTRLLASDLVEIVPTNALYVRITAKGVALLSTEWTDAANEFYNRHP